MQVKYLLLCKGYLNITSTLFSQISATSSVKLMEDLAILQKHDLEAEQWTQKIVCINAQPTQRIAAFPSALGELETDRL